MLGEVPLPCKVILRNGKTAVVTALASIVDDNATYPIMGRGPLLGMEPLEAGMKWTRNGFNGQVFNSYDIVDIIITADNDGDLIPYAGQKVDPKDVVEEKWEPFLTPGEVHAKLNEMKNGPWKGVASGLTGKQDFEEAKKRFEFDLRNFIKVGDKCVTRAGHLAVYKGHSGNKEDPLQFFDETSGTRFKVTKEGRYNISPDNPKENGFDIMHPDWAD